MIKTKYNIGEDCEAFLSRDAERREDQFKTEQEKNFLIPHHNSGYQDSGEICMKNLDGGTRTPYKVSFN